MRFMVAIASLALSFLAVAQEPEFRRNGNKPHMAGEVGRRVGRASGLEVAFSPGFVTSAWNDATAPIVTVRSLLPAPPGGLAVTLDKRGNQAFEWREGANPQTYTILEGQYATTVQLAGVANYSYGGTGLDLFVKATAPGSLSGEGRLRVNAPSFHATSGFSCSPTSIGSGYGSGTCTARVAAAAPLGGVHVSFTSANGMVIPTLGAKSISSGATTTTFTVSGVKVFNSTTEQVTASIAGASKTINLSIYPPGVMTFTAPSCYSGASSSGTLAFSGYWPSDVSVRLSPSTYPGADSFTFGSPLVYTPEVRSKTFTFTCPVVTQSTIYTRPITASWLRSSYTIAGNTTVSPPTCNGTSLSFPNGTSGKYGHPITAIISSSGVSATPTTIALNSNIKSSFDWSQDSVVLPAYASTVAVNLWPIRRSSTSGAAGTLTATFPATAPYSGCAQSGSISALGPSFTSARFYPNRAKRGQQVYGILAYDVPFSDNTLLTIATNPATGQNPWVEGANVVASAGSDGRGAIGTNELWFTMTVADVAPGEYSCRLASFMAVPFTVDP